MNEKERQVDGLNLSSLMHQLFETNLCTNGRSEGQLLKYAGVTFNLTFSRLTEALNPKNTAHP